MLGPGEVGGRSDVPWSLVGDGWTVTVWARTPLAPGQTLSRPIEQTVFLVDPVGGRYEITSFKAPQLAVADISGDHARALLSDYDTAREVNLQTGAVAMLALPFPGDVRYTKPRGLAVVVLGAQEVRRIGLDGSTQHTYLKSTSVGLSPALTALYSPDGSTVVFGTSTGLLVEGNDGSNPHTVSPPNTSYCWAPRWWAPNVVLASCNVDGLPGLQLWKVPVDGAAPAALTPVPRDGLGNTEAWPVNAGTFVAGGVGCGGGFVPRMLDADGSTRDLSISVPGQDHGDAPELSGVTADSVFVRVNVGCQLAVKAELVRYDPAGGTATVLFGGTAGGGAVVGAKTISSLG
jgi:TolB protein